MSYYTFRRFNLSDHVLVRIKERIKNYQKLEDYLIRDEINKLLNRLNPSYDDGRFYYYQHPEMYGYYFVVSKDSYLIVTFSKISYDKLLRLNNGRF